MKTTLTNLMLATCLVVTPSLYAGDRNAIMVSQGATEFSELTHQIERITSSSYSCFLFFCGYSYTYENAVVEFTDKLSNSILVNYEHIFRNGMVLESSLGSVQSSYTVYPATSLPSSGDINQSMHTVGLKYYFNEDGWFQPFVGLGMGMYSAKLTGEVHNTFVNWLYQAKLGLSVKVSDFRIFAVYTHALVYEEQDATQDNSGDAAIGEYVGSLDLSSRRLNLGVAWLF